ncbi:MAG: RNA polymerase sigma factor RpoD/SigA [Spirochaetaceae bacterium]|jgi:RNA polymerase primary sigma factor|nr:RNA polymerase sigma factor RpoD/SigA [Spirochaetaceae bacterium]
MSNKRNSAESAINRDDSGNVLAIYLREINKIPLLSRDEEDAIAKEAVNGSNQALDKLVQANLRFVVNVAKKYQGQGLPLSDLISEGNIGLLNAVGRYDVSKGNHFITYAVWWIRQAILKAIGEKSRMIRLPMNRSDELVRIRFAKSSLQNDKCGEAELIKIAESLDMEKDQVEQLINISRDMISLDAPVYSTENTSVVSDYIEDDLYKTPYEYAEESIMRDDIEAVLATLDKKEADVIRCRYGIGSSIQMSLSEIGDQFNLTKERIRQIEKKAIKRLQQPARRRSLHAYVA